MWMQKFSLEEEVHMPTCNQSKIIHNIWFKEYEKKGACLYGTTSNDYVWTFRQSALYYAFLHDGHSGIGLDRDELRLRRVNQSGDPLQMVTAIAKLALSYSYTSRIPHLEGEEVFGFIKQKKNLPHGSKDYSHKHHCVNFFSSTSWIPIL